MLLKRIPDDVWKNKTENYSRINLDLRIKLLIYHRHDFWIQKEMWTGVKKHVY